jgi:hypothetical protein
MLRAFATILLLVGCFTLTADAQSTRTKAAAAPKPVLRTEAATVDCPNVLGDGVKTGLRFCDVLTGNDAASGVTIRLPKHRGPAVLTFALHNRQMYSPELERSGRAYTRATATIGVLTLDGTLLQRALVRSEFRRVADLVDRISGGAGPGGVKAVAPVGSEPVVVEIPEKTDAVSLLGEKLAIARVDGEETVTAAGRPIAIVSDVRVQYEPAPPQKKKPVKKRRR